MQRIPYQYPKSPALLSPTKGRFIFPVLTAVQSPSEEAVNDSRRARYTLHTLPGSDCDNYGTPPSAHYFHHQGTLKPVYKHGQCRSTFSLTGIKENEMSSGFRGRELAPNTVHDKGIEMIQFPRKESLSERNWRNLAQHRGHLPPGGHFHMKQTGMLVCLIWESPPRASATLSATVFHQTAS